MTFPAITRRVFIGSSMTMLPAIRGDSADSDPPSFGEVFTGRNIYSNGAILGAAKAYKIPKLERRYRPTWGELSPGDLRTVCNTMNAAYEKMQRTDCHVSFARQAWLHAYQCSATQEHPVDLHSTWLFLPWHRGFVFFHERMIQKLTNCPHFRLPAWDWSDKAGQKWPTFFKAYGTDDPALLPPLPAHDSIPTRNDQLTVSINKCMLQGWMLSKGYPDFMGTADKAGDAYWGPHSYVHANLRGLLMDFNTSALDPLFYSHHANMDRFFSKWWNTYPSLRPKVNEFRSTPPLQFLSESGVPVTLRVEELLETEALGYRNSIPKVDLYEPAALNVQMDRGSITGFAIQDALRLLRLVQPSLSTATGIFGDLQRGVSSLGSLPIIGIGDELSRRIVGLIGPVLTQLPFRITFTPDKPVAPNFYVFGLSVNGRVEDLPSLGGFGALSMGDHVMPVTATLCITERHLQFIVTHRNAELVYGLPGITLNPEDPLSVVTGVSTAAFLYPSDLKTFTRLFPVVTTLSF